MRLRPLILDIIEDLAVKGEVVLMQDNLYLFTRQIMFVPSGASGSEQVSLVIQKRGKQPLREVLDFTHAQFEMASLKKGEGGWELHW